MKASSHCDTPPAPEKNKFHSFWRLSRAIAAFCPKPKKERAPIVREIIDGDDERRLVSDYP